MQVRLVRNADLRVFVMKSDDLKRAALIPAAGYGRRVGSPEAKELFLRQNVKAEPLIEQPLRLARECGARAVVVTRSEKKSLVDHLSQRDCELLFVPPTRDWAESLLLSKPHWQDMNLICLPDVEFSPHSIMDKMFDGLLSHDVVFATFQPKDFEVTADRAVVTLSSEKIKPACHSKTIQKLKAWGVVDVANHRHCEKPQSMPPEDADLRAWGLFGFRREFGEQLLQQMLDSTFDHQWRLLPGRIQYLSLTDFFDLTRS
jgi:hypothetical protein